MNKISIIIPVFLITFGVTIAQAERQDIPFNERKFLRIAEIPFEGKVGFRVCSSRKFLAGNTPGTFIVEGNFNLRGWQTFDVIHLDQRWFAMKALNGKFVRGGIGEEGRVAAVSDRRDLWQSFRIAQISATEFVLIDGKNRPLTLKNTYLQASSAPNDYSIFEWVQL